MSQGGPRGSSETGFGERKKRALELGGVQAMVFSTYFAESFCKENRKQLQDVFLRL